MMISCSHILYGIVLITLCITHVRGRGQVGDFVVDNDDPSQSSSSSCVCGTISDRPDVWNKVATARWMVHNIDWGVLTTISSRNIDIGNQSTATGIPFGNVYSFVDGSCTNGTGIPYFYGTYMDQSLQDMKHNSIASFTLSEASVDTSCMRQQQSQTTSTNPIRQSCRIVPETVATTARHQHHHHDDDATATVSISGDPESPICARLTVTGMLQVVPMYSIEFNTTLYDGFHVKHPQMSHWPIDHHWMIFKLNILDIWLIDYFGGATTSITPPEYFRYHDTTATRDDVATTATVSDSAIESHDPL